MTLVIAVIASIAGTLIVVFIVSNLTSPAKKVKYQVAASNGPDDPQFTRAVNHLLGPPAIDGNSVELLSNGRQIFPAILAAIAEARRSICLETFIYWQGEIGRRMKDAIVERAAQGVAVHVLIDWLGSNKIDEAYVRDMTEAGAQVERHHPVKWYTLDRMNNRTHRKILVIDGRIGFTGGVGIADEWDGDAQDPDHWRDVHFRVRGPVVAQMQAAFMDNWIKARSCVLLGEDYFPRLDPAGDCVAQMFRSSARGGAESMRLMFLLGISAAAVTLSIGNAYFVPDDLLVESLIAARQRGVAVRIVVPGKHIDTALVRRASRARWGDLLKAGCEIREYQPTMYHSKLMVVDEKWVTVGSTNFDNRSLRLNDEANLAIFDAAFATSVAAQFAEDVARSEAITYEQWLRRPFREKLTERMAALLRSQL